MNYLAHIFLSGENDRLKMGNFMADSIKGKKYLDYPKPFQNGIILHRAIDYYTDTHPIVMESMKHLFPSYSHYSGIIVDIFYDHFLASNWDKYSEEPLLDYTERFYALLETHYEILPKKVKAFVPYMIKDNWLYSYSKIDGIKKVLQGMNRRTGGKSGMDRATNELITYYDDFESEFKVFFKDLMQFSEEKIKDLKDEYPKESS